MQPSWLILVAISLYFPVISEEKVTEIVNLLVKQITNTCGCGISNEYVTDLSLTCETRDDEIAIFQARIISTVETRSTELLEILQDWARDEPLVVVNYVQLRLVMECSVQLNEIGETECIPIGGSFTNGTGTTASTIITPQPTVVNTGAPVTATPHIVIIAVIIIVCGIALLVIIIVTIYCCYLKRKKKKNIKQNHPM